MSNMRLDAFLEKFYLAARIGLRPGSIEQLKVTVRQFSGFLGYPAKLNDLSVNKLREYLADFYSKGRSPGPSTPADECS